MLLYHGNTVIIEEPSLMASNANLDLGPGFYTTTNLEQAVRLSKKAAMRRGGSPVVSVYDLDDADLKDLKVKVFESPDREWLGSVIANRRGVNSSSAYDLIIGSVADDDVYGTISLFESGFYSEEEALNHLKVKKLFNQYVFVSEEAVKRIVFKGVISDGE